MSKRVLAFGTGLAVLVVAMMTILAGLDVITMDQLWDSLPRLIGVVAIGTVAVLLTLKLGRFAKKR